MLMPVARFCIKRSIKLQEVVEIFKVALLQAAEQEIEGTAARPSGYALAMMTGVHRKDIARLSSERELPEIRENMLVRVISQWQLDKQFTTKAGKPRILSVGTNDSQFAELVHSVSRDLSPGAVLGELERINAVQMCVRGVKLALPGFTPRGNMKENYILLANDIQLLMTVVEENTTSGDPIPHFHATTEYDNVSDEALSEIKTWLAKQGSKFHQLVMKHIAQFDHDSNPNISSRQGGGRVALVSFGLTQRGVN